MFEGFTADLHVHVGSLFEANIFPKDLCSRIKEMGGLGCAITDVGVLSSIETYRRVFAENGLKLIPGCEIFIENEFGVSRLVVLAVNDHGYIGIGKIVTESNYHIVDGTPIIKEERLFEILKNYQGDIIALSGCSRGILSHIFLLNKNVNEEIKRLSDIQSEYTSRDSDRYKKASNDLSTAITSLNELSQKKTELGFVAGQKFKKRETAVEKLKGTAEYDSAVKELNNDKQAALDAADAIVKIDEEATRLKAQKSIYSKVLKSLEAECEKYDSYTKQINEQKNKLVESKKLFGYAVQIATRYLNAFGPGNFYAEIQNHGLADERKCFTGVIAVAKELNIPIVASNNVSILTPGKEDRLKRQLLRSLGEKKYVEERIDDAQVYLKDDEMLSKALLRITSDEVVKEAISNIKVIFDRCNVTFETGKHYPVYKQGEDAYKLLVEAVKRGAAELFPEGLTQEYKDRFNYELKIIKDMGYSDYFLIVKDFLEYGRLLGYVPNELVNEAPLTIDGLKGYIKEHGWKNPGLTVGPGRGSGAGSLVCYSLHITNLDPIKHGLLFERFLNPERISMPDIDSDFANLIRGRVIEYVKNRYGAKAVCGIMTTDSLGPKGAIRKVATRFYGEMKYGEGLTELASTLCKDIPSEVGVSFSSLVDQFGNFVKEPKEGVTTLREYLLDKYQDNEDAIQCLNWAFIMENSFTQYGAHAAGIVISDNDDISDYVPLMYNDSLDILVTQCDKEQVEDNGLLKFDFLGLKTLDVITGCLRFIEKEKGIIINPLKDIPFDDAAVFRKIFSAGKTGAVFQFESQGMKNMLKRFKPETFEDLIILVSMFRPGPLQYLDDVIAVKNGLKEMTFLCPELAPILGKTYGAIVYQEQVMEICQKLAGFTLGHADSVRKYMSKKKADKLEHERESFIEGCLNNGISKEVSETLFSQMMDFASYAFNKSHAAVYAFSAYITAWLKYYYPAQFFASALNWATLKKLPSLMQEAKSFGIKVLPPDINLSERDFTVSNDEIRFGFSLIKGLDKGADNIMAERENGFYSSPIDFMRRINPDKTIITNLIDSGALDTFSQNRAASIDYFEAIKKPLKTFSDKTRAIKCLTGLLDHISELTDKEKFVSYQKKEFGSVLFKDPLNAEQIQLRLDNAKKASAQAEQDLSVIKFKKINENLNKKMEKEHELLGLYVTGHPIDGYPSAEKLNVSSISNVTVSEGTKVYGVISSCIIKNSKKTGKKFALLTIEDKEDSIDAIVFNKAYEKYQNLIKAGNVLIFEGPVEEDDFGNDEDADDKALKLIVNDLVKVDPCQRAFDLEVSSYEEFVKKEESFRKEYEDVTGNGHPLNIFDKATKTWHIADYTVKDSLLVIKSCEQH